MFTKTSTTPHITTCQIHVYSPPPLRSYLLGTVPRHIGVQITNHVADTINDKHSLKIYIIGYFPAHGVGQGVWVTSLWSSFLAPVA